MVAASALAVVGVLVAGAGGPAALEGTWQGTIHAPNQAIDLTIRFHVEDGKLTARLDVPQQGATDLALQHVSLNGKQVHVELTAAHAEYNGTLSDDGTTITGKWTQSGQAVDLTLKHTGDDGERSRPQDPKKPYPYDEEEVTYRNEAADVTIAGTLTLPRDAGPHPAVLLITGSGPQDRNEAIFGHRPFLVLADALTRRGLAVLRVDDRGVGGTSPGPENPSSEDFAGDVEAGIAFLKSRKEVDPERIALLGHSEGGMIAPMVAADSKDVAALVLLAGPGLTGEQIILQQTALINRAGGVPEDQIEHHSALQRELFAMVEAEPDDAAAKAKVAARMKTEALAQPENANVPAEQIDQAVDAEAAKLVSAWMRFFLTYDPLPTLRQVKCPVLALNGEKDLQVPAKADLEAIETALKEGGNEDVTVREMPGLNHLFQHCTSGAPSEYGEIDETMSPEVLKLVGDWLVERLGPK